MKAISLKVHLPLLFFAFFLFGMTATSIAQQQEAVVVEVPKDSVDSFAYSPMGRRDPFKPLIEKKAKIADKINTRPEELKGPLEKFEISQFRLLAIMIVKGTPRAMVKAPDGKSYTVKVNDYIGMNAGRIKNIETKVIEVDAAGMRVEKSPDRIVVEETGIDSLSGKEVKENRYIIM